MNLDSELEIMQEIESAINDSRLQAKLARKEVIKAEDFLNESADEVIDHTEMKSLYLTEPFIPKTREMTRNNNFGYCSSNSQPKDVQK